MNLRIARLLLWLVLPVARLESSDTNAIVTSAVARRHVVMVNERGRFLDPATKWNLRPASAAPDRFDYDHNIAAIQKGIADFQRDFKPTAQTAHPRVVVFVHGGLNSYSSSLSRLERLLQPGDSMLTNGFYPILLVWNSGFVSSYREHLLSVRQGEIRPVLGPLTAPFILPTDLAKGAVRLPLNMIGRWFNDFQTIDTPGVWMSRTYAWEDLEKHLDAWQREQPDIATNRPFVRIPVPEGQSRSWGERFRRGVSYVITQPTKIATLPLADGLATEAWDNMIRRTKTMFQPPETYHFYRRYRRDLVQSSDPSSDNEEARKKAVADWMARRVPTDESGTYPSTGRRALLTQADGTMFQFAKQLEQWTTHQTFGADLEWHFFGHSMGAMVLIELLGVAPDIVAREITYLAAACSIRSFQENIVPYLRRQNILHTNRVEFHNLCLHRIRERDNSMDKIDLIPRGTLLNYIDDMFAHPVTVTDRTLGSWENLIQALPDLPVDLRPQIHNVGFDLQGLYVPKELRTQPQDHSAFAANYPFWEDDFVSGPKNELERQQLTRTQDLVANEVAPPPAVSAVSEPVTSVPAPATSKVARIVRTVRRLKKK